ncbi:hypothetical protein [Halodesulfurarchaeum formicicum]|uniref:ArsR family transcriptional regulator n=1 Tax=Halodesulfurarchaeum formicicum TaxID=1873524 RepID=A0A1J1ACQ5_9EURY|nr:hypothetical protein [Halodesulfurarchaeum formicicum]APE95544.1 hypothetical protein HSR6_1094 [Halodesulfurarchaeum formicicum]
MERPDCAQDFAPHTEIVYEKLAEQPFMTQDDLIEGTHLPFLAVRDATETLKECNLIEEIIYSHGKLRLYRLKSSDERAREERQASVA